jgi:hypothetical protein
VMLPLPCRANSLTERKLRPAVEHRA